MESDFSRTLADAKGQSAARTRAAMETIKQRIGTSPLCRPFRRDSSAARRNDKASLRVPNTQDLDYLLLPQSVDVTLVDDDTVPARGTLYRIW